VRKPPLIGAHTCPAISSRKPSVVQRGLLSVGLPLILVAGLARSPFAQSGPGNSTDPRTEPGQSSWGDHMGPPRHRMAGMGAVEGPASPAILRDTIQLSGDKLQQYTRRYDAYMASTKVARDSLRANLEAVRSAFQSGDRSAAHDRRDIVIRQSQDLAKKDQQFEKDLKGLLNKDQQKRYDKWKDDRQKSRREHWRGEHPHGAHQRAAPDQQDR
jgi:hypothetical protein